MFFPIVTKEGFAAPHHWLEGEWCIAASTKTTDPRNIITKHDQSTQHYNTILELGNKWEEFCQSTQQYYVSTAPYATSSMLHRTIEQTGSRIGGSESRFVT
jgi:hypothetical protein